MPFLIAAVVLVGAIAVLNLLLTMAVIRRLRRNEMSTASPAVDTGPEVGTSLPELDAESVSNGPVSTQTVAGSESIFAFFSTTCSACKPSIPHFVEYIEKQGIKPAAAIAVVGGELEDADEFLSKLDGKATVVMEPDMGPITSSFNVAAFPTFVMADDKSTVTRTESGSQRLVKG